ncbi:hypothetical protein M3231_19960 [Neobacillus mesonae]|nr:hypothetical protein [Neobacillus mesonae]
MMNHEIEQESYKTIMITVNGEPVGSGFVYDGLTLRPIKTEGMQEDQAAVTI